MSIERWSPVRELETMRREMDRIWEEMFPAIRRPFEGPWRQLTGERGVGTPAIDIIDRGKELVVKADMPGVGKEDIDISLHDDTLTITGEVKAEKETKEDNYYHMERRSSSFSRSVSVPFKVEADKISASLKNGVLTVTLPKSEAAETRKIKVEVG